MLEGEDDFYELFFAALNLPGKSKKLAVIFPGIRYSPECPLLYYAQKLCVREGYEILPLYYPIGRILCLIRSLNWKILSEKHREKRFVC